jgi:hypothetical protein
MASSIWAHLGPTKASPLPQPLGVAPMELRADKSARDWEKADFTLKLNRREFPQDRLRTRVVLPIRE